MSLSIEWFGLSSFRIQTKLHNEEVVLVTDPPQTSVGLKLPRSLIANIVLVSEDESVANNVAAVGGGPFLVRHPGEYEIKNVFVYGLPGGAKSTIFRIEIDDLVLAFLGSLKEPLPDEMVEKFENVDILFVPVGGGDVLDAKKATAMVNVIEPRVVIPMQFQMNETNLKLDSLDKFLKEIGASKLAPVTKYKISRKDLPEEEMQVVILARD